MEKEKEEKEKETEHPVVQSAFQHDCHYQDWKEIPEPT